MANPPFDVHRAFGDRWELGRQIRRDQLEAVRRSVPIVIPVNMILGSICTLVAVHAGQANAAGFWFAASLGVNLLRIVLCRLPCAGLSAEASLPAERSVLSIDRHLRLAWLAALLSGVVWAFLPVLCGGYTSPQTLFFLMATCGITAGAVSHGTAFARMAACFITPPLLSVFGCLVYLGGFDRSCIAAMVLLYLLVLTRSAFKSEAAFRDASRLKNEATALAHSLAVAHASARALAEEMERRATHDILTGLLNRAGFLQMAEARLLEPATTPCLMLLDLDGFKSVNDVYGHDMGDRVLVEVANRLRGVLPAHSLVARLGGDEFALLYDPENAGVPHAVLAGRLIDAVAQRFETFDAGRLGISIGVHHANATSLKHRLICADQALYAAKNAGRNRFRLFDAGLDDHRAMRVDIERDLSQALAEGGVEVWFQPIYGRNGGVLVGLEALVRWRHPHHGWIPPKDIIAAAAVAGLSEPLLRFILDQVCAMMSTLRRYGRKGVRVSMNVSPREMAQIAVDEIVLGRLRTLDLPPSMMGIEITEETALDIRAVEAKFLALAEAGVHMALDDFGTGYASLSSLLQLQAKRIKIDRSFVTGLSESPDKKGLIQAVIGLGLGLGIEVVAEGVETAQDFDALQSLGCLFFQGDYLGEPMPPGAALKKLLALLPNAA